MNKKDLKEKFNKQKPEDKLRILNSINDQLTMLVHAEFGTLPIVSTLAAALLVVATFNSKLLPLTSLIKIIISVLIFIIPLSLIVYIFRLKKARNIGEDLWETYQGKRPKISKGFWDQLLNESPLIFAVIIFIAIIIIFIRIWNWNI
jgi:hypothetical protein